MHHRGIMHRDLKPNNVLVNEDCYAKLCDFGLSRAVGNKIYVDNNYKGMDECVFNNKKSMDVL